MIGAILGGAGAGALLGGIAGAQGQQSTQSTTRELAPASAQETSAGNTAYDALTQLQQLVAAGPGQQQVANGLASQNQLAALLQQYAQSGGVPTQAQTGQANNYAAQAFQGQQNSLNNTFNDQRIAASRSAATQGRGAIDPVLQNKLFQEQSRQQGQLSADQSSFAGQYANQISQNQLNYTQQFAGVQSGLASQAMQNRQALLGLGQQLRDSDRNFRNNSANVQTTQSSGGGFMGALSGALAGAGSFASGAGALSKLFAGTKDTGGGGGSSGFAEVMGNPK